MSIAITLHLLAAVIWVGGMFFAYMALRPVAATLLEPPQRLPLWSRTFARFFPWVWACVVVLPVTGYWMIFAVSGGMGGVGIHVHIMQGLGLVMIGLYLYVVLIPYRSMNRALAAGELKEAGACLGRIRQVIGTNLLLGLIVAGVAGGGRFW